MKYKVENSREPYGTPFGPGPLFAIRADEFWRLSGYDKGPYVWGGENTEMAFKMWMYGGRMLMVPAHASVTTAQGKGRTRGVDTLASDYACQND